MLLQWGVRQPLLVVSPAGFFISAENPEKRFLAPLRGVEIMV